MHGLGGDRDHDPEMERWIEPNPLDEDETELFKSAGCSLHECYRLAAITADQQHSAIRKCYGILADANHTMHTMRKLALMQDDAFLAGSAVAGAKLKEQFELAYGSHKMELKKADQEKQEQAQKEELERQAQKATELAEGLMKEEEAAQQKGQKQNQEQSKKKKGG